MRCYGFFESGSDWAYITSDKHEGPGTTAWRRIATRYMRKCARAAHKEIIREWEADTHPDAPYLLLLPWDYVEHGPCPWTDGDEDTSELPWWIQVKQDGQGNISYVVDYELCLSVRKKAFCQMNCLPQKSL